jgi:hypothetical protein
MFCLLPLECSNAN